MSKILSDEDGDTIWNDPTPNIDDELEEILETLSDKAIMARVAFRKDRNLEKMSVNIKRAQNQAKEAITNKIKEAELEAVYNVFYMVWIEDGAPLQRDDPPSEILRYIEKLEGSQDER